MKIFRSILGILSFMIFLMGIIYGGLNGIYISSMFLFLMFYFFGGIKFIENKCNIKINFPSLIYLILFMLFIYFSFYEKDIILYNLVMAFLCTLLSWLFVFYINIRFDNFNIYKNIVEISNNSYDLPDKSVLKGEEIVYSRCIYRSKIDRFFEEFDISVKYIDSICNSYMFLYKYEIRSETLLEDIVDLKIDLELKLKSSIEIENSGYEDDVFYIKVLRKNISNLFVSYDLLKYNNQDILLPLGENEFGEFMDLNISKCGTVFFLGEANIGKSKLMEVFINSILLRYTPNDLNIILIDKHQISLDLYGSIPHLVLPLLNESDYLLDYLDSIVVEINRRINSDLEYSPLIIFIDEVYDINCDIDRVKEYLDEIISLGKGVLVYLIISSSILNDNELVDYLYNKISNHIYFYGRDVNKYNPFKSDFVSIKGLINSNIEGLDTIIRTFNIKNDDIEKVISHYK